MVGLPRFMFRTPPSRTLRRRRLGPGQARARARFTARGRWSAAGAVVLLCACAAAATAAAQAAAASTQKPSTSRPPEVLSWRHQVLPLERYGELASAWEQYVEAHPEDPRAWVEWGDALRYAGDDEAARAKYARAFAIDSTEAGAITAYVADMVTHRMDHAPTARWAYRKLRSVAESSPDHAPAYYMLYIAALTQGDAVWAKESLRRMVTTGDMPPVLLDYAYNLLVSAPPGAILFTNGDNDTYPPLAQQALYGVRPDVAIVNLSLLNTQWYIRHLREIGLPIALDDRAIDALRPTAQDRVSDQMQRHIAAHLERSSRWREICYAVTVYEDAIAVPNDRVTSGLVWRLRAAKGARDGAPRRAAAGSEAGSDAFDLERTRRLLDEEFRLASITDPRTDWARESSVVHLGINYAALLGRVALGVAAEEGAPAGRPYLERTVRLLAFHDKREMAELYLTIWEDEFPRDAAPERWRALFRRR